MQLWNVRLAGPWGSCILCGAFAAFALWYTFDAYGASSNIQNLLFVVPVSALAITVCLGLIAKDMPKLRIEQGEKDTTAWAFKDHFAVPAYCAASVLYVIAMPYAGFDVATAFFVAAGMAIQSERRWWLLVVFPIAVGLASTYAMRALMSFPIPTLFFG